MAKKAISKETPLFESVAPTLSKGEKRKQQILDALIDEVGKNGLDATSFETIGKSTNMQRTHVSYYFSNREEMVRAMFERVLARMQTLTIEHIRGAKATEQRFRFVVEAPFVCLKKYPRFAPVMTLFYYYCSYDKSYSKLQTAIREMGEQRIAAALEPWVFSKKLTKAGATKIARNIQALQTGQLIVAFTSPYPITLENQMRQTYRIAKNWVDESA